MQSDGILCVIGARGGGQGVPGKNISPLLGEPFITWAIEKALAVTGINRVVVSTDSERVAEVAVAAGADVPFTRPLELASSDAGKFHVWQQALDARKRRDGIAYDVYVDIDCTNPLLQVSDIKGALQKFRQLQQEGVSPDGSVQVSEARRIRTLTWLSPAWEGRGR